jgi:hypothetical protein
MSQIVTRGAGDNIEGVFFSPYTNMLSDPKARGLVHISNSGRSIRVVPTVARPMTNSPPTECLGSLHWDEDGQLHAYSVFNPVIGNGTMFKCTCPKLGQNWSTPRAVFYFPSILQPPYSTADSLEILAPMNLYGDARGLLAFGSVNRKPCGVRGIQKPGGPFYNKQTGLCNVTGFNAAPTPFGALYSTPWWGVDFAMRSTDHGDSWAVTPLDSDRPKTSGKTNYGTMMAHGVGGCETAAAPTKTPGEHLHRVSSVTLEPFLVSLSIKRTLD